MASVRQLKKDINNVLGDIIDAVTIWEMTTEDKASTKGDEIIENVFDTFDNLISKVNQKGVENKKSHFRAISEELETSARGLVDKINAL